MNKYIDNYSKSIVDGFFSLNSLGGAINRYLFRREKLIEKARISHSRWVRYSGRIKLYNVNTTKKNVNVMKQIYNTIFYENDMSFYNKFCRIRQLKSGLSKRGKARKLIDFFIAES
ncbi:MAG: hypothetical protein GY750_11690 [Lentisphaerae bacterium]|nr:hypothetical protein [Lentisphaerota bacterium]MCP4102077.1 hypothetical protein [Lentisphaerota bacterium]